MNRTFLQACESEPLHRSGAILSHGALVVADREDRVCHVSDNLAAWLEASPQEWLGKPLPETLRAVTANLGGQPGARLAIEAVMRGPAGWLDGVMHRDEEGCALLEFTAHQPGTPERSPRDLVTAPEDESDLQTARDNLMQRIARLTGFQRVMYYRFLEQGDGEVVAEARQGEIYGAYLGLRFPASDIPLIARSLYLKNPWRLIPDAAADPVPVLGREAAAPDLTWSDLRSVSPVHRVYLANMGVRASLSFPVVLGGVLTALVACHHSEPRQPSLAIMEYASHLIRTHAMAVSSFQSRRRMRLVDGLEHRFDAARELLQRQGDLLAAWPELGAWLMREFQVDGAQMCLGDSCALAGKGLEPETLAALNEWLQREKPVWAADSLSRQVPGLPLSEIAGVLTIRVVQGKDREARVYLCRQEHIHEVAWGGNPDKPVEYHDGALGIAPRRSFEKWMEKRLGYSRPWDNESRLLALKLRELLLKERPS